MLLSALIPSVSTLIPYEYPVIKTPEYEHLLQKMLDSAPSVENPTLIHMLGIPGAGKSTFYHKHKFPPHLFIGFDSIMEQLPSYQTDTSNLGSAAAFQKWEIPARILGYELLRRAVEAHKNIFFDHGGLNPAHLELLQNLHNYGYTTEMHHIICPLNLALKRAQLREQKTHRHTPQEMIKARYALMEKLAAQYQKIADTFYVYDNSSGQFILRTKTTNRAASNHAAA